MPVNAIPDALPDLMAARLAVVFCGINPGLRAAATGHHFTGPTNRFWRVIHLAGFTPEEIRPEDDRRILQYRCGLTTVVKRPTARADQLAPEEFAVAAAGFRRRIEHYAPRFAAFLGKAAYGALSGRRDIAWGRQPDVMGSAAVWVLPNPSGRNRSFGLDRLVAAYRQLQVAASAAPDCTRR
jgi:TDG/mug DNA glycosylase family protein